MGILLVAFSFGIILAQSLPSQCPEYVVAGSLAALGSLFFAIISKRLLLHRPRYVQALLGFALCALGFAWSSWAANQRLQDALSPSLDGQTIQVQAWIDDLTQIQESGLRMTLAMDPMHMPKGVPSRISVIAPLEKVTPSSHLHAGTCHRFTVRLRPVHGHLNFYGLDSSLWMWSMGIRASGKVLGNSDCPSHAIPWKMHLQQIREEIRSRILQALPHTPSTECCSGILVALAVGDQSGVDQDQWSILWRTGVGHLVSISGVHVTLLAGMLRKLAERSWRFSSYACRLVPATHAGWAIGCIAACAYALVAGFSIPTQRTLFMLGAGWFFSIIGIHAGAVRILGCAVAITLLLNPFACLSPSFWLSYAAVGGLILADMGQFGKISQWRAELKSQWVVNLALLPLVALWFGQLSVISPLANAIAIPWVGMLVTPLTLIAMFPHLSFFAVPANMLMQILMQILHYLAQPSWAAITLLAPDTFSFWLAIAGIICLLIPLAIPHRYLACLSLLPLTFPVHAAPAIAEARIEVLDIGQGLSVLIRTAHHAVLFDTGPRWHGGDSGQAIILPILKTQGIGELDQLILSHPDADHIGGAESIVKALPIQHTYAGYDRPGAIPCLQGQHWNWDQVRFEFLYPTTEPASSHERQSHLRNNHACVLKISLGPHSVLIPADIEAPAERELVEQAQRGDIDLNSEVVLAAHHGSHTSSTAEWIAATHAKYVIFSAGWRNHFHHPHSDVLQRWIASGAQTLRTDQLGAIRLTLTPKQLNIETALQARRGYWNEETIRPGEPASILAAH